jgi:hypothetical protein
MGAIGAVDVVERGIETVRKEARTYLATVGVLLLAVAALEIVQGLTVGQAVMDLAGDPSTVPELGQIARAAGLGALFGIAGFLLSMAVAFFALAVTWDLAEGRETSLSEAWDRHGDRFLPYIGLALLIALAAFGVTLAGFALFFLIIPPILGIVAAVYLLLRWYVAPAALIDEGLGIRDAMGRSRDLTEGEKVSIVGIVFLVFLVGAVVSLLVGLVAPPYQFTPLDPQQATSPTAVLGNAVASYVSQLVTIPLGAAALVHAYRDLREAAQPPTAEDGEAGPEPAMEEPGGFGGGTEQETREVAWDEDG